MVQMQSKYKILSYIHAILLNNSNINAGDNIIMFANWFHNGINVFKDINDDVTKTVYPYSKLREINHNLPEGDFKLLNIDTYHTKIPENEIGK